MTVPAAAAAAVAGRSGQRDVPAPKANGPHAPNAHPMFKRIVVPLDGSEAAELVLPFVAGLAAPSAATVILHRTPCPVFLVRVSAEAAASLADVRTRAAA